TRIDLYKWLASAIGRDKDPGERANNSRLIELMVALDFSDRGVRCGPLYWGRFQSATNISQIQDYKDWFTRNGDSLRDLANVIDFSPLSGVRTAQSWLCAPMAIGSELCQAWGVPGFTMMTLDDLRLRRDT